MRKLFLLALLYLLCILEGTAYAIASPNGEAIGVCGGADSTKAYILKSYNLFFPVNCSDIDRGYLENDHVIETMINDIRTTIETDGYSVDSLLIYASASPEGPRTLNESLAKRRAESTKGLILDVFPEIKDASIKIESRTNDWSGIYQTLRSDNTIPYRDLMLGIFEDSRVSNKEEALRRLPLVYTFIRTNMLHKMRTATVTVKVIGNVDEFAMVRNVMVHNTIQMDMPLLEKVQAKEVVMELPAKPERELKPFYISAKTNMLYDLVLVPNVGVDIYLGKNFSLNANWMYSWWKDDNIHWYWRTYGGDAGIRYWFGKAAEQKPLTGHHVGLYGQIITYDFELGGRGYLGDRWTYGGGVEYGYSLPIASRLNIDFDLGFGFLAGEFKEYLPIDGHYVWQATKRRQYIGPTKAEISLVWQIGRGNINADKGGKR